MSESNRQEQSVIQHILMSAAVYGLMHLTALATSSLRPPAWGIGLASLVVTVAGYAAYLWSSKKWLGEPRPLVWLLTVIGADILMRFRAGLHPDQLRNLSPMFASFLKTAAVVYAAEWLRQSSSSRYANRLTFVRLAEVAAIAIGLLFLGYILEFLFWQKAIPTMAMVLYILAGGWTMSNAYCGMRDANYEKSLGSSWEGSFRVFRYLQLRGPEAVARGINAFGLALTVGALYFYGRMLF